MCQHPKSDPALKSRRGLWGFLPPFASSPSGSGSAPRAWAALTSASPGDQPPPNPRFVAKALPVPSQDSQDQVIPGPETKAESPILQGVPMKTGSKSRTEPRRPLEEPSSSGPASLPGPPAGTVAAAWRRALQAMFSVCFCASALAGSGINSGLLFVKTKSVS